MRISRLGRVLAGSAMRTSRSLTSTALGARSITFSAAAVKNKPAAPRSVGRGRLQGPRTPCGRNHDAAREHLHRTPRVVRSQIDALQQPAILRIMKLGQETGPTGSWKPFR